MNNYVLVKITGKNVNNYVKWLIKHKINVIELKIIKHDELNIIVDYKEFDMLRKYSKTYKVVIAKRFGKLRLYEVIKNNVVILLSIIIGIFFIYFCSNYIFSIDIVYNDQEIVKLLKSELAKYDIVKFRHKKDYDYLQKVKENILKENKDALEWLEIEESGTKYIVRLVERKKETKVSEYKYQSIVAKKDATIVSIKAYAGERAKLVNEYVKRDDVIISGIITKPDGTIIYERAKGVVVGEVWYKIQIDYPFYYYEEKLTGRNKEALALYFLNKEIPIFPYKRYKHFNKEGKVLIEDNFIPLKIIKEKLYEVYIKEEIYPMEQVVIKAKEEAVKRLMLGNKNIISIRDTQVLKRENKGTNVKLDLFVAVNEDITKIMEVSESEEVVEN